MDCYGCFYRPSCLPYLVNEEYYDLTHGMDEDDPCNPCFPTLPVRYVQYSKPPVDLSSYGCQIVASRCAYNYEPCQSTCSGAQPPPTVIYCQPQAPSIIYLDDSVDVAKSSSCHRASHVYEETDDWSEAIQAARQALRAPSYPQSCLPARVLPTIYKRQPRQPGRPRLIAEYVDVIENCRPRRVYTKTFSVCEKPPISYRHKRSSYCKSYDGHDFGRHKPNRRVSECVMTAMPVIQSSSTTNYCTSSSSQPTATCSSSASPQVFYHEVTPTTISVSFQQPSCRQHYENTRLAASNSSISSLKPKFQRVHSVQETFECKETFRRDK